MYHRYLTEVVRIASIQKQNDVTCHEPWSIFLQALSSSSPVCALIPPTTEVASLLNDLQSGVTEFIANPSKMAKFQVEVPVLFMLVKDLIHYPVKALTPVIGRLLKLSTGPFSSAAQSSANDSFIFEPLPITRELSFFPQLKIYREKGNYICEHSSSSIRNFEICNKKSSRHPTLLPGIFTIFCEHGKC